MINRSIELQPAFSNELVDMYFTTDQGDFWAR